LEWIYLEKKYLSYITRHKIRKMSIRFKWFFITLLLTTLLPFIPYLFRDFPIELFGFNLTGWAWMIMFLVSIFNLFFIKTINFPLLFWLPWITYLIGYLLVDYSFLGLQLTLQYTLPIIIGVVVSGFEYSGEALEWLFKWFIKLCIFVFILFLYGYLFRGGYVPAAAATPMLLSIALSLFCALFFATGKYIYLIYSGILFLAPVIDVTRMGIASMAAIFVLHFANNDIIRKFVYGIFGLFVILLVFNSKGFQNKTFYNGTGTLKELTFNYYDNPNINSSGRLSWKLALQPGLEAEPVWGNGPRADNEELRLITGLTAGEAHNDYMSVRYNYGYVGLGLLLAGFLLNFISLFRIAQMATRSIYLWLLTVSTMTLFVSFLLFMYSDNILKYTIYFPNYFFAMIGIIYSLKKDENYSNYTIV
jgi:hypothetical protein